LSPNVDDVTDAEGRPERLRGAALTAAGTNAERLRGAGLRVTAARLAILEAVRAGNHPGTEEIARNARVRVGHLTLQGVYEALGVLTSAGLVRRIEPAGSPARYEARVADNHHHIVCRRCGLVTDVDCVVGAAPCLEAANAAGYAIDEAEVTFWGLCPRCQGAAPRAHTGQAQHPDRH
jgi:Fur family transcriptional regulator, stress-responsive regulator